MKKTLCILLMAAVANRAASQEPIDALRPAWTVQSGTARVQAIGGAMGSLGGDVTATFVNPAGLGFYKTGDFVFTPSYSFGKTSATYLGRKESTNANKFALGTTGVVWGSGEGRKTKSTAISFAINQVADFKNTIVYRGQNNQSSYSQRFLEEIQNDGVRDANTAASDYPYGTSLAFNTYWIDTVGGGSSNNYSFQSRAPIATGLLQQHTINTRGGITEFAIGVGVNLNDKVLLGGSIGIPVMRYERDAEFVEADATANTGNRFNFAQFTENITTSGVGFNLKAGIIFKPQEYWRLGFAFHTPTIFSLLDRNNAEITTDTESYQGTQTQELEDVTGAAAEFRYMQVTPLKLIGSASYVLREIENVEKQRGFITADVEYVMYPVASFLTDDENYNDNETREYLNSVNEAIDNSYKGAFNVRAGGELKFTTFMVRGGVAYYGNPYKDLHDERGSRLNLSGGLGYRNKGFFIDATYVHAITKDVNIAYRLANAPYYNADLRTTAGKVLLTFGFKI